MVIKFIKSLFNFKAHDPIEDYLSQSTDLVDLENRMKELKYKGIWI